MVTKHGYLRHHGNRNSIYHIQLSNITLVSDCMCSNLSINPFYYFYYLVWHDKYITDMSMFNITDMYRNKVTL
jgi:hypothetical protein